MVPPLYHRKFTFTINSVWVSCGFPSLKSFYGAIYDGVFDFIIVQEHVVDIKVSKNFWFDQ